MLMQSIRTVAASVVLVVLLTCCSDDLGGEVRHQNVAGVWEGVIVSRLNNATSPIRIVINQDRAGLGGTYSFGYFGGEVRATSRVTGDSVSLILAKVNSSCDMRLALILSDSGTLHGDYAMQGGYYCRGASSLDNGSVSLAR